MKGVRDSGCPHLSIVEEICPQIPQGRTLSKARGGNQPQQLQSCLKLDVRILIGTEKAAKTPQRISYACIVATELEVVADALDLQLKPSIAD